MVSLITFGARDKEAVAKDCELEVAGSGSPRQGAAYERLRVIGYGLRHKSGVEAPSEGDTEERAGSRENACRRSWRLLHDVLLVCDCV
jgi:hypothetical protein